MGGHVSLSASSFGEPKQIAVAYRGAHFQKINSAALSHGGGLGLTNEVVVRAFEMSEWNKKEVGPAP